MDATTPDELQAFKKTAIETLQSLKPSLDGVLVELTRQQRTASDHEYFLLYEFRNLTTAINNLAAQLAGMP
jgi:hypothetical protein